MVNKAHEVAYFLLLGAFAERPAEGKFSVDKTSPILCSNLPLPNSCSASCMMS